MHEHEWAFHHVNSLMMEPKLKAVFKARNPDFIFARELAAAAVTTNVLRVLSIGSGDCSREIQLARIMWKHFNVTCVFTCFETSDKSCTAVAS